MEPTSLKILHVSDIHYRASTENIALLESATRQFEQLRPDYILITGDLSRDGLEEQFAHTKRFIDSLNFCHVLTIPGNRDVARPVVLPANENKSLANDLPIQPSQPLSFAPMDGLELESSKGKRADAFLEHFAHTEFFYRDTHIAAAGLNSTPELTAQHMEVARQHFLNGRLGELRIFCAHHSFLPVPTKKLKPGDIVPHAADILQTLLELNVDLLCCGHIHRSHVWDLSDGGHRLLCCNAGSLLDTSGKKDNGYLEIEIEHDLRITKRSLFTSSTEQLYHRQNFGDMLQARQQVSSIPVAHVTSVELAEKASEERIKIKKAKNKK
jgi:3',5'-cyclic-AMP phosphodiesterase